MTYLSYLSYLIYDKTPQWEIDR